MTVYRDAQLAMSAPESPYGTAATIDRRMPYTGDLDIDWEPNDQASEVIEPGAVATVGSSYRPTESVKGTYNFEVKSKGFGRVFRGALGAGVSNLVSAGLYQQNFTLGAGPLFDAHTWQVVRKMMDGTDDPHTFLGMVINSLELSMDNAGVLAGSVDFIGRTMSTAIAKASLSLVAANRFTFAGFSIATGTLTEPTTTALASGATALDGIRSFSVKIENSYPDDDFRGNGAGLMSQPSVLQRKITGSMEARNTAQIQALRTTWRNNGTLPIVANFVNGTDHVQATVAAARLTDKPTPNADGNLPTVKLNFEGLLGTPSQPFWLCTRTSDTAI